MAAKERKKEKAPEKKSAEAAAPLVVKTAWDTFHEYMVAILVCIVIALFVVTFIVHPMAVPTESMQPPGIDTRIPGTDETYARYGLMVGDRLLVDKFSVLANQSSLCRFLGLNHPIRRGDVVVFKTPDRAHYLIPYVKRVIGLPGESIVIAENRVYIDDKVNGFRELNEPYAHYDRHGDGQPLSFRCDVPEGHYFMMGDNRDNSSDSRVWGPVPEEYIFGKPLLILWSFPDNEIVQKAFPDGRYQRGVHTITDLGDVLTLYFYRLIYFYETRWGRMFHFIPRGNCSFIDAPAPAPAPADARAASPAPAPAPAAGTPR